MNDRELLAMLAAGPTSGAALAARLGISRSAVHKHVEALRESGIGIDAQAGRSYALRAPCDLLDADRTVYARGLDLAAADADVPVGPACRLCTRADCASRQEEAALPGEAHFAVRAPLVPRSF